MFLREQLGAFITGGFTFLATALIIYDNRVNRREAVSRKDKTDLAADIVDIKEEIRKMKSNSAYCEKCISRPGDAVKASEEGKNTSKILEQVSATKESEN